MARRRNAVPTRSRVGVGVGIVGAGLMGRIHAESFERERRSFIAAVYNPSPEKARALVADHGGDVCDSVEALLAHERVDAVVIASPQKAHGEQILAALAAGKHVFAEKPVALTRAELDAIGQALDASGLTFMTGHQLRFHPVIEVVREAMPELGRVYHLDLSWSLRIDAPGGRCWESYREGGFFMELGCHLTDLAICLLGRPRHVTGATLRLNPQRVTEDYANCVMQFESAAVAQILVSANHRIGRQGLLHGRLIGEHGRIEFTIYPYGKGMNRATLILDGGKSVFVPDLTQRALPLPARPSPSKVYPGFYDVYVREAGAFLDAIASGAPVPCTFADGRAAVEAVLAVYHAQHLASKRPLLDHPPKTWISDADSHPPLNA